MARRHRASISRSLRRIVDATEDLFDDALERSDDVERDLRHSLSKALDDDRDRDRDDDRDWDWDDERDRDRRWADDHRHRERHWERVEIERLWEVLARLAESERFQMRRLTEELARLAERIDRVAGSGGP